MRRFSGSLTGSAAVAMGGSLYGQNLRVRGRPQQTFCARLDRPVNALQLCG